MDEPGPESETTSGPILHVGSLGALGSRLTWVAGLVLMLSAAMGWYAGSGIGPTIAVIGWHTGALGKLVFVLGAAVLALVALQELGIQLPASLPESLIIIVLGSIATVFVVIRIIDVPDEFFPSQGRGIGIFIALIAALGVVAGGLLRATEEL